MSRPDLVAWSRPLRRFADLHARTGRTSRVRPILDYSYPNPKVRRDPRGVRALRDVAATIDVDDLQYSPFGGDTVARRRVASALSGRLDVTVNYRDVVLTPGGTAALCVLLSSLFRPGDEIVVSTPCWMDYPVYLARFGLVPRMVPSTPTKRIDVAAIERACTERTAGVIVSQPHCPSGTVATADELDALSAALVRVEQRCHRTVTVVSDEVHRDQVWAGVDCPSPMTYHPASAALYSFGKAWSMQGQRTGYAVVSPRHPRRVEVREDLVDALRVHGFCAPTALMQAVAMRLVGLAPDYSTLADDQRRFRALVAAHGLCPVPGEGSAFVYCACPPGVDDWALVERLAAQGVLAMPSSIFHEPGHVRFSLNVSADANPLLAERLVAMAAEPSNDDKKHEVSR